MSTRDYLQTITLSLGLRGPGYTVFEGRLALVTALPCGRGEETSQISGPASGVIASFAQKNYYKEMVFRLKQLAGRAAEAESRDRREYRIFCNSSLPEKRLAIESRLGLQGKNSLIYLPREGSYFILGGILFPQGPRQAAGPVLLPPAPGEICGSCTACRDACPVGAISAPGKINREKCIQGLAAGNGPLPAEVRKNWGRVLYGCDVCQAVCPLNGNPPEAAETLFGVIGPTVPLEKILAAGEEGLRKTVFAGTVLDRAWISGAGITRNAVLAAADRGARELRSLIVPLARHPDAGIRDAAEWALRRLES